MEPPEKMFCRGCMNQIVEYRKLVGRLTKMYESCTSIKVKNIKAPKIICLDCVDLLKRFYKFRQQCHDTAKQLEQMCQDDVTFGSLLPKPKTEIVAKEEKTKLYESDDDNCFEAGAYTVKFEDFDDSTVVFAVMKTTESGQSNENKVKKKQHLKDEGVEDNKGQLTEAIKIENDYEMLQELCICNYCHQEFSNKKTIAFHLKYCQTNNLLLGNKPFKKTKIIYGDALFCGICNETLPSEEAIAQHLEVHSQQKELICGICFYKGVDFADLVAHRYKHQPRGTSYAIKCYKCNRSRWFPISLEYHYRQDHLKQPPGLCRICHKSFRNTRNYKIHMRFHGDHIEMAQCKVCNKSFKYAKSLSAHMRMHTGEKHVCHLCGFKSWSNSNMKEHIFRHKDTEPQTCSLCGKVLKGTMGLKLHVKQFHTTLNYECTYCEKKFQNKSLMLSHMAFHSDEKPFLCVHCPNRYKTKSALTDHMLTHTTSVTQCEFCHKNYPNSLAMKNHMKRSCIGNPDSVWNRKRDPNKIFRGNRSLKREKKPATSTITTIRKLLWQQGRDSP